MKGTVILIIFIIFWTLSFLKKLLFWSYLWQLKEYHLGRFKAHFDTYQGKKLIFNFLNYFKLILIIFPLGLAFINRRPNQDLFSFYLFLILAVFLIEGIKFFFDFLKKKAKLPVLTLKTFFILGLGILTLFLIIVFALTFKDGGFFYYVFLVTDFFSPLIVSLAIAIVHFFTVIWRFTLIKKAIEKRRKFPKLTVIGITGSYGKSSTKEFLAEILKNHFKVLKTEANQNSEVAVSRTILEKLSPEHDIFVCEMGAYNQKGIQLLSRIARPKIGVLTGITEQHLATFGSLEKIIKTKYELIESLPEEGLAVFNGDNIYCRELYQTTRIPKRIVFSEIPKDFPVIKYWLWRDLWAEDIVVEKRYLEFKLCTKEKKIGLRVNLLGRHNIPNLLLASQVARRLGLKLEEIAKAIQSIDSEKSPLKLRKTRTFLNVVDSSYSANPNGVLADLEYLISWKGKRIIIMPCLIELGKKAKEIHYRIGQKIGQICDLAIITSQDYFQELKAGALNTGMIKDRIVFSQDPRVISDIIFVKIKDFGGAEDVILIEGRVGEPIKETILNL